VHSTLESLQYYLPKPQNHLNPSNIDSSRSTGLKKKKTAALRRARGMVLQIINQLKQLRQLKVGRVVMELVQ